MGLFDIGLKAVAGKNASTIKQGVETAGKFLQDRKEAVQADIAAQPTYDVASPEMIKGLREGGHIEYAQDVEAKRTEELKKHEIGPVSKENQSFQKVLDIMRQVSEKKDEEKRIREITLTKYRQSKDYTHPAEEDTTSRYYIPEVLPSFTQEREKTGVPAIDLQNDIVDRLGLNKFTKNAEQGFNQLSIEKKIQYANDAIEAYTQEMEEKRETAKSQISKNMVAEMLRVMETDYVSPQERNYAEGVIDEERESSPLNALGLADDDPVNYIARARLEKEAPDYLAASDKEKGIIAEEAKEDIPRSLARTVAGVASFGLADVLGWNDALFGVEEHRAPPRFKENLILQETAEKVKVASSIAAFIGTAAFTYGAVAKGVSSALNSIPKVGSALSKAPVFVGSMFRNAGETGVEAAIRIGSGQEYGIGDMIIDLAAGSVAEAVLTKGFKTDDFFKQTEEVFQAKELELGRGLQPAEARDLLLGMPIGHGGQTFGDVFQQQRMAYLKGQAGGGRKGIEIPAEPPKAKKGEAAKASGGSVPKLNLPDPPKGEIRPKALTDTAMRALEKKIVTDATRLAEAMDITVPKKTFKAETAKATKFINSSFERARAVVRGEKKLPKDVNPARFLNAMESFIEQIDDVNIRADLHVEFANNRVASEITEAAQTLSFMQRGDPHSVQTNLKKIKDMNERAALKKAGYKDDPVNDIIDVADSEKIAALNKRLKEKDRIINQLKNKEAKKIEKAIEEKANQQIENLDINSEEFKEFNKELDSFLDSIICPRDG